MTARTPAAFKVTELHCEPDLRCSSTTVETRDDGLDIGIDCVLHFEHNGDHTDGDGTYWDEDGDVDYR